MLVKKRDGRLQEFDPDKILNSIKEAALAVEGKDDDIQSRQVQINKLMHDFLELGMDREEAEEQAEEQFEGYLEDGVYTEYNEDEAIEVLNIVTESLDSIGEDIVDTGLIQELVEKALMDTDHKRTAKEYIIKGNNRSRIREMNTSLMKSYEDLTFGNSKDVETKRENANIDGDSAMGTMLKYGSEGAKKFNLLYLVPPDISEAHSNGDIHIHDLDFMALTETCCQIDLEKLFNNGFNTGHGFLREPGEIRSYAALACIAIQSDQNDQHGGQSIPSFDHYMAPGVAKSFVKNIYKILDIKYPTGDSQVGEHNTTNESTKSFMNKVYKILDIEHPTEDLQLDKSDTLTNEGVKAVLKKYREEHRLIMNEDGYKFIHDVLQNRYCGKLDDKEIEAIVNKARAITDDETHQAMEAVVHNLNSMHSRAGRGITCPNIA